MTIEEVVIWKAICAFLYFVCGVLTAREVSPRMTPEDVFDFLYLVFVVALLVAAWPLLLVVYSVWVRGKQ